MSSSRVLLSDNDSILSKDIEEYDIILSTKIDSPENNIYKIEPHQYFMEAHKQTRVLNKKLLEYDQSSIFLSLLKGSDRIFFDYVRIILILEKSYGLYKFKSITIDIENNSLFNEILLLLDKNFSFDIVFNINNTKKNIKKNLFFRFCYFATKLFKYLILSFVDSNKKDKQFEKVLVPYYSAQSYLNISHLDNKDVAIYPLMSSIDKYKEFHKDIHNLIKSRVVTGKYFIAYFKQSYLNYKLLQKSNIPKNIKRVLFPSVFDLSFYDSLYKSFVDLYGPKNIIGQFDATWYIDYLTEQLNKMGVITTCIPHGVNYKYKVNYISQGVNEYSFWSIEHKKQFDENVLVKNCDTEVISGFIGFKRLKERYLRERDNFSSSKKSILIIGEYFSSDNYYTSPFNYDTSKRLFEKLKEYNLPITVRTRLDDDYHRLANKYTLYGFKITDPSKKDIFTEIMEHDLVISVFSNALHESLLLRKKTLQVNFLGIENYRNLADRGLVYYASSEDKLDHFMSHYVNSTLPKLNFDLHEKEYCSEKIF